VPAAKGCIENPLVLDAILASAGEGAGTIDGCGEGVEHAAVRIAIRKYFLVEDLAARVMDDGDGAIDGEPALRGEDAIFADDLDECAVLCAEAHMNAGEHAEAELQGDGCAFFEFARRGLYP